MILRSFPWRSMATSLFLAVLLVAIGWLALILLFDEGPEAEPIDPFDDLALSSEQEDASSAFVELAPFEFDDVVPTALAVASDGCIMVVGAGRLMLLEVSALPDEDDNSLAVVVKETLSLAGDACPTCIAVGGDGTAYVGFPRRIDAVSPDGATRTVANFAPSARITSLAVREPDLFAADAGNRVVCQVRLADGAILREIGRPNPAEPGSGFVVPSPYFDLALGGDGSLWVVNPGHHRLENYAADGTLRTSWQRIGSSLADFCGCCNPVHVALLPDGSFLTAEKAIPRVKVYGADREFRELVAGPDAFDEGAIPGDVAMLPDGRVLVLDLARRQIRVFQRE